MTDAGRELDALVAVSVMGFRVVSWHGDLAIQNEDETYAHALPHFSTDLAAAWGVVEHLFADGWALNISAERGPGKPWDVRYWKGRERGMAFAETAPEAICRAALSAVGQAVVR